MEEESWAEGELGPAALQAWLEACCLPELQALEPGGCLALDVPVVDLAGGQAHAQVVAALLQSPERLRQATIATLLEAELLPPGCRLWLRPRQLPAPAELGVPEALECMRAAPGALLACHGVCVAASAPIPHPAARAFQCACCAKVCVLHSLGPPPPCCGGQLAEVESERVMVQAQVVYLADDAPLASAPSTRLGGSLVAVRLLDDLVGRVAVGDRVLATGAGSYCEGRGAAAAAAAPHLPVTLGVQMEACNVEPLRPALLTDPWELGAGARRHLAAMAASGLDALLQAVDAAAPPAAAAPAASPLLKLALLLSAAAAGTGATQLEAPPDYDPEPQAVLHRRGAASRNQVNVMLTAAAPEPHTQRLLTWAAATLCGHSVRASASDPKALLPFLDAKWQDPAHGVAAPLAVGGQLGEAGGGVLLLSSSALDARRSIGLGQYMAAGEAALAPGCPELCVPVGATLWTTVHEQDLAKSGRCGPGGGGVAAAAAACGALSLTERIINRYSQPFFCQHDVLLPGGPETEDQVDVLADCLLGAAGPSQPGGGEERAAAAAALAHHVAAARAARQPALGAAAMALLSAYFQHLRTYEDAQAGVLASLARVACASARLRGSPDVQPLPDAALAVALVEEKLGAAGATPLFWPRWRQELLRCTPLEECLRGLAEELARGLPLCGGSGGDDGWGMAEE